MDEQTPVEKLTSAWHDHIAKCSKTCIINNDMSSKFSFDIILSDEIASRNGKCAGEFC